MRAFANILIVASTVAAMALASANVGCKGVDSAAVKSGIATAGGIVNAVDNSPACVWVAAVAGDPSAGAVCKGILDILGGALGVIPSMFAKKAMAMASSTPAASAPPPPEFKELRVGGALKGVLRSDVAAAYASGLVAAGVADVVVK